MKVNFCWNDTTRSLGVRYRVNDLCQPRTCCLHNAQLGQHIHTHSVSNWIIDLCLQQHPANITPFRGDTELQVGPKTGPRRLCRILVGSLPSLLPFSRLFDCQLLGQDGTYLCQSQSQLLAEAKGITCATCAWTDLFIKFQNKINKKIIKTESKERKSRKVRMNCYLFMHNLRTGQDRTRSDSGRLADVLKISWIFMQIPDSRFPDWRSGWGGSR